MKAPCGYTHTHTSITRRCFRFALVPSTAQRGWQVKCQRQPREGNSLQGGHVLGSHTWLCNTVTHLKSTLHVPPVLCLGLSRPVRSEEFIPTSPDPFCTSSLMWLHGCQCHKLPAAGNADGTISICEHKNGQNSSNFILENQFRTIEL